MCCTLPPRAPEPSRRHVGRARRVVEELLAIHNAEVAEECARGFGWMCRRLGDGVLITRVIHLRCGTLYVTSKVQTTTGLSTATAMFNEHGWPAVGLRYDFGMEPAHVRAFMELIEDDDVDSIAMYDGPARGLPHQVDAVSGERWDTLTCVNTVMCTRFQL